MIRGILAVAAAILAILLGIGFVVWLLKRLCDKVLP